MQQNKMSRRGFLGTAAGVAAFTVVPRHVLGGPGQTPPSEKLNIAGIGVGGQGAADLEALKSQNIVALCDVDWHHAAGTFAPPQRQEVQRLPGNAGQRGYAHRRCGRRDAGSLPRGGLHGGHPTR